MEPSLIIPGPRVRQLGPVLAIETVTTEDGLYPICFKFYTWMANAVEEILPVSLS